MTVSSVYRADIRSPDRVFVEGFRAWGTNTNFISHILGLSGATGSRNSAFIPTTSNHDIAAEFARERAVATGQEYYVYNIRATDNMYPALDTVYNIYDSYNVRVSEDVRGTVAREQEYSAYSNISPQQIRSVEVLRFSNGHWTSETRDNPNYVESSTRSHDGPYMNSNSHPLNHTARLLVGFSAIGAEFLPSDDYDNHRPPISCFNCFSHSEF
ncbi:scabin-related ADP-ribosyltransferase [Serratia marcescens]|uniref:scabin-related ADP-ribosyltransferase n=1 Tax=Serratia marcescens TaxID=615 RepID=UPI003ED95986